MCGIAGYSYLNDDVRAIMPHLLLAMHNRGRDSWGVTDGINVHKELGPLPKSLKKQLMEEYPNGAIFHTRAGSVGAVTIDNQHPFKFERPDGSYVIGVHNGHISNYDELGKKYNREALEVDSMQVYAQIANDLPLYEIRGWGALAWYECTPGQPPQMKFARFNMTDFHVFKLASGPLVFCSLDDPVIYATAVHGVEIDKTYAFKGDQEYFVSDTHELMIGERMVFGNRAYYAASAHQRQTEWWDDDSLLVGGTARPTPPAVTGSVASRASMGFAGCGSTTSIDVGRRIRAAFAAIGLDSRRNGLCAKCAVVKIDRSRVTICDKCKDEVVETFQSNRGKFVKVYA